MRMGERERGSSETDGLRSCAGMQKARIYAQSIVGELRRPANASVCRTYLLEADCTWESQKDPWIKQTRQTGAHARKALRVTRIHLPVRQ